MDSEKKEIGKWWMWILLLLIISLIVFSGLSYFGMVGRTIVERKVFEESYQRSESVKSEISIYEAQIVEINHQLSGDLDPQTRTELEAKASSIRVLLTVARRK